MNILIISDGKLEEQLILLCQNSKYLNKIYTASKNVLNRIPNIEFNSFDDLVVKSRILQIDLIILTDKILIQEGLVEFLKEKRVNVISANKKWFNLESSRIAAKQLLNYYSINNQKIIKAPTCFPIVVKTNNPKTSKVVNSMQELIEVRETLKDEIVFLEECLYGEIINILSLWDGSSCIHFQPNFDYSEVQQDRLDYLKTKINFMLSEEKADFVGFFSTKIIWAKNDWYVLDFKMRLNLDFDLTLIDKDILYLLNIAIYQKLNEISF